MNSDWLDDVVILKLLKKYIEYFMKRVTIKFYYCINQLNIESETFFYSWKRF